MITATLQMTAIPERRDEILQAIRWLAGPARVEPGRAGCRILQDLDDEDVLVLVEEWTSREGLERRLRSDEYRQLLTLVELSARPPEIRFDTVARSEGLELVAAARGVEVEARTGRGANSEPCRSESSLGAATAKPVSSPPANG